MNNFLFTFAARTALSLRYLVFSSVSSNAFYFGILRAILCCLDATPRALEWLEVQIFENTQATAAEWRQLPRTRTLPLSSARSTYFSCGPSRSSGEKQYTNFDLLLPPSSHSFFKYEKMWEIYKKRLIFFRHFSARAERSRESPGMKEKIFLPAYSFLKINHKFFFLLGESSRWNSFPRTAEANAQAKERSMWSLSRVISTRTRNIMFVLAGFFFSRLLLLLLRWAAVEGAIACCVRVRNGIFPKRDWTWGRWKFLEISLWVELGTFSLLLVHRVNVIICRFLGNFSKLFLQPKKLGNFSSAHFCHRDRERNRCWLTEERFQAFPGRWRWEYRFDQWQDCNANHHRDVWLLDIPVFYSTQVLTSSLNLNFATSRNPQQRALNMRSHP